jgi:Ig-like domain-containing protein
MKTLLVITALIIPVLSCSVLTPRPPTPTSAPTLTPTVTPTITRTLAPSFTPYPSPTPHPTWTPEPLSSLAPILTPSPPPTFVIPTLSPPPTLPSALDCHLNWQSPRNGVTFHRDVSFSAGWKVTNTGTATWAPGRVDFVYMGGAKMYDDPLVRLRASVVSGQSVVLTVRMRTPLNSTKYTTYWSLRQGQIYFCHLSLTIYVN